MFIKLGYVYIVCVCLLHENCFKSDKERENKHNEREMKYEHAFVFMVGNAIVQHICMSKYACMCLSFNA